MKRVVVIVAAVAFFRHPVSPLNAVGTAMALGGVFLYSQQKLRERGRAQQAKLVLKGWREAWSAAATEALLLKSWLDAWGAARKDAAQA